MNRCRRQGIQTRSEPSSWQRQQYSKGACFCGYCVHMTEYDVSRSKDERQAPSSCFFFPFIHCSVCVTRPPPPCSSHPKRYPPGIGRARRNLAMLSTSRGYAPIVCGEHRWVFETGANSIQVTLLAQTTETAVPPCFVLCAWVVAEVEPGASHSEMSWLNEEANL